MLRKLMTAIVFTVTLASVANAQSNDPGFEIDTKEGFKTFFEQIALEGLPGPAGDVISVMQNSPELFRAGLIVWLRKKMINAAVDGKLDRFDKYRTLYTCMALRVCGPVRKLPKSASAKLEKPGKVRPDRFYITQVFLPAAVKSGARKETLTVFWVGNPQFPVTMIFRPSKASGCPDNFNCSSPEKVFSEEADPLRFEESVWCEGVDRTYHLGYEVLLRDATGRETVPAPAEVTCIYTGK